MMNTVRQAANAQSEREADVERAARAATASRRCVMARISKEGNARAK